ncbi:CRISPR-associated helicase, Cas3 family [Alkalispirochaeta americana]|uniref:CRISPR-associated helicase, Cas3 family n=1 Tax=Alkalispirochaeta americana TaxID=159291 RepID=A0A1N6NDR7_9SPIO|nr:CRISPR-associated helicase/endonuclease Cas3 [Alkalispirochaeta americana]SIP90225.1 CRISPR-associated helicase, Cas3 family [Alkalispirochaeta americana]
MEITLDKRIDDPSFLVGHSRNDGALQPLEEHLHGVAKQAGIFADLFGCRNWGVVAGLLHDDGKCLSQYQRRIRALIRGENAQRADHSTPGAKYAIEKIVQPPGAGKLLAYCVAGHHTGIPDGASGDDESCLSRRLNRSEPSPGLLADELPEIEPVPFTGPNPDQRRLGFQAAFFTRMVFSCLVDADFLDTEAFVDPDRHNARGTYPTIIMLKKKLDEHLIKLVGNAPETVVNRQRQQILAECRCAAREAPGLRSLSVPTGGGKTLSSLAFALDHAVQHDLRRVIYVIPYTSIIEQTAQIFRSVFGDEVVLEHHSNLVPDRDDVDEDREERRRLACENWDPPIIVTTNVQFFESFFSNRSSRTRRLHNVARSVVILDEAQMLPVPFLKPTIEVIRELSETYRSTIVLCTATQPALIANESFQGGLPQVREIVSNPEELERVFDRVDATMIGEVQDKELASRLATEEQVLCIVNTRGHARKLVELLDAESADVFHLSALMCPTHRRAVLDEIRDCLAERKPCRVVSTQLVEAGVDLDFPVVYRALAGIDSIVQAAGRCNREGKLAGRGKVHVFRPEGGLPAGYFRQNAQIAELVLRGRESKILRSSTVREFFRELYWIKDESGGLDKERILDDFRTGTTRGDFPFKTVSGKYRLIADEQIGIIVPNDKHARNLCRALEKTDYPGAILRRLQPYTVSLRPRAVATLLQAGYVQRIREEQYVMTDFGMKEAYDDRLGLNPTVPSFYLAENLIVMG